MATASPQSSAPFLLEDDVQRDVRRAGLLYIRDDQPGFTRRGRGRGFQYIDEFGDTIRDDDRRDRLEGMSIPPAWDHVWICPQEDGYLQATGRDGAGRKQYIYHTGWHEHRARQKYEKMVDFARALGGLRAQIDADLRLRKLSLERVSALALAIMDRTAMRVGHEVYSQENGSYGLTTLRTKHVTTTSTRVRFDYIGKSGVERHVMLNNRRLSRQLQKVLELKGEHVFQYEDEAGCVQILRAEDINDYIAQHMGEGFSAKDFRTWRGTLCAAVNLWTDPWPRENFGARLGDAIELSSEFLGNTKSVCRNYYIHCDLLEHAESGELWTRLSTQSPVLLDTFLSEDECRLVTLLDALHAHHAAGA